MSEKAFPDNWHDAMKVEPNLQRMIAKFRAEYSLGEEGERMLVELNERSRIESGDAWTDRIAGFISGLNEATVREQMGLPPIPTP